MIFYSILFGVPLLGMLWWWWADGRLRGLSHGRWWRVFVGGFMATFLLCYGWYILVRWNGWTLAPGPWLMALMMLWALIFLPLLALPSMLGWCAWRTSCGAARWVRHRPAQPTPIADTAPDDGDLAATPCSRRQVLAAAAVSLPAVATLGATALSIPQKRRFRIREIDVALANLPPALHGLSIAHVSDTHVGKFTRGAVLDRIARATNDLAADLVLLTGDLIDHSVADLPDALDMVERIDPRSGLFMIEGNHDLFDGRDAFTSRVRLSGVPLLLDQVATLRVRGERVQIMGIQWHGRGPGRSPDAHVDRVAALRDPEAFPILLAHHPHAFDRAAEHGVPLTLAGHTHGGQLMLPGDIGFGPWMYKYWSGLYHRDENHAVVVSNGAGNWFPLRSNAPAEILRITLKRA